MKIKKYILRELIYSQLKELSTTSNTAGYNTPYAFTNKQKNQATKESEKLGYKVVKRLPRPSHSKLVDYLN